MPRLPKYQRAENPPAIRNLKYYLPLLELIESFQFIDSKQIGALTKTSRTNTYEKLKRLYHNGLVERYVVPMVNFLDEPRKIIYTLNQQGADILINHNPEKYFENIYFPHRTRSIPFVWHELMISNFRVCLTLAIQQTEGAELVFWLQGNQLKKYLEKYQIKDQKVIPDGYFLIRQGERELHYFLEADQGTMPLNRFYDKIKRYLAFFGANRKKLPKQFRVLGLAKSAKRAENLQFITIKGDKEKKGSQRFWFFDETLFSLNKPNLLLDPILRVGHVEHKSKISLLD